jgi:hypothetical protein
MLPRDAIYEACERVIIPDLCALVLSYVPYSLHVSETSTQPAAFTHPVYNKNCRVTRKLLSRSLVKLCKDDVNDGSMRTIVFQNELASAWTYIQPEVGHTSQGISSTGAYSFLHFDSIIESKIKIVDWESGTLKDSEPIPKARLQFSNTNTYSQAPLRVSRIRGSDDCLLYRLLNLTVKQSVYKFDSKTCKITKLVDMCGWPRMCYTPEGQTVLFGFYASLGTHAPLIIACDASSDVVLDQLIISAGLPGTTIDFYYEHVGFTDDGRVILNIYSQHRSEHVFLKFEHLFGKKQEAWNLEIWKSP